MVVRMMKMIVVVVVVVKMMMLSMAVIFVVMMMIVIIWIKYESEKDNHGVGNFISDDPEYEHLTTMVSKSLNIKERTILRSFYYTLVLIKIL